MRKKIEVEVTADPQPRGETNRLGAGSLGERIQSVSLYLLQYLIGRLISGTANQCLVRKDLARNSINNRLERERKARVGFALLLHGQAPPVFALLARHEPRANAPKSFFARPASSLVKHEPSWKKSFNPTMFLSSPGEIREKPILQFPNDRLAMGSLMIKVH